MPRQPSASHRPTPAHQSQLRTRITGLEYLPAHALQDHAGNWRVHPQFQEDVLRGTLQEIGIAGALLVYHSVRQGGITTIDGHLRKALDPAQVWPCLMTDLDDAEADYVLASLDPLSAMAEADREKLGVLLHEVQTHNAAVQQMWEHLGDQYGIGGELGADATEGEGTVLLRQTQPVKIALEVQDTAIVEQALCATGLDNRGKALVALCEAYLTYASREAG
jgi:hypothetical protein